MEMTSVQLLGRESASEPSAALFCVFVVLVVRKKVWHAKKIRAYKKKKRMNKKRERTNIKRASAGGSGRAKGNAAGGGRPSTAPR
jgi:hypothetical protein